MERFACSYCGTNQVVERAGGTVFLRKIQSAIHAVQRGTDKTAAELAIPRLTKELSDATKLREKALSEALAKSERARRGRRMLTTIIAIVILFGGFTLVLAAASASESKQKIVFFLWLIAQFAVPLFVFKKVKLPPDTTAEATAPYDALIAKIEAQLRANRTILDDIPH